MIMPLEQIYENAKKYVSRLVHIESSMDMFEARRQSLADVRRLQLRVLWLEGEVERLRQMLKISRSVVRGERLRNGKWEKVKDIIVDR